MTAKNPQPKTRVEFKIDVPVADTTVPAAFDVDEKYGAVKVKGTVDSSTFLEVRVMVLQGSPPAEPPRRAVPAPIDGNEFLCEYVPWAKKSVQNTAAAWARDGGGAWSAPVSVNFEIPDITVDKSFKVSAKRCIWFTWADSDLKGPVSPKIDPREVGAGYRPIQLPIPDTAASLTITASGEWGHCEGDGCKSDANGKGTKELLKVSEYQSKDYSSQDIEQIAQDMANLNRLVGVWIEQYNNDPTHGNDDKKEGAETSVGKSSTFNLPSGTAKPTRLALGLHDSFEWSDNEGELSLEITWTEE